MALEMQISVCTLLRNFPTMPWRCSFHTTTPTTNTLSPLQLLVSPTPGLQHKTSTT